MRRALALAGATALAAVPTLATLPANAMQAGNATVSVLHGVPGLTVDVYANGEELIPDFEPGTLTDPQQLPAGTYDLQVFADGDSPGNGRPAIEADGVEVPAGANATVVAHLDADGNPALTPFVNDTSQVPAGQARLTVRHTAAAPAVDVRADEQPVFTDLSNPDEEMTAVPAGTYGADVTLAGTNQVAIGPADLRLTEGTNTIVYAWGSAQDENLNLAVQSIDGMHSAPGGVPSGEAGLLADSQQFPYWALGLGVTSVLALIWATSRLTPASTRSGGRPGNA
jgi:Domain of unknown function (DUF4397)